jgi:hypothetical protein
LSYRNLEVSQVPLLFPVRVIVAAGTTRTISFPDEFLGVATSLNFQNQDGANAATFRYGGEALPSMNLPASSFRTVDGTQVKLAQVVAGAAGNTIVEAQCIPIKRSAIEEVKAL